MPPKAKAAALTPAPQGCVPYFAVPDGKAAVEFYKKAFNGKLMTNFSDKGMLIHAEIVVGDEGQTFMVSSECPEWGTKSAKTLGGSTHTLIIHVKDVDKSTAHAEKNGAVVVQKPENHFWGDRSSKVRDPFGYEWCFTKKIEEVSDAECAKRWDAYKAKMEQAAKPAASPSKKAASSKKAAAVAAPVKKTAAPKTAKKKAAPAAKKGKK